MNNLPAGGGGGLRIKIVEVGEKIAVDNAKGFRWIGQVLPCNIEKLLTRYGSPCCRSILPSLVITLDIYRVSTQAMGKNPAVDSSTN